MTAKVARIEVKRPAMAERRRKTRQTARNEVTLKSTQGDSTTALLRDITLHGCAARVPSTWTRPGAFVSVCLEKSDPIQAIVRWVRDDMAGMEFLWPVPEAHLAWHALLENPLD